MEFLKSCLSLLRGIWWSRIWRRPTPPTPRPIAIEIPTPPTPTPIALEFPTPPTPRPTALEFSILAKLPVELIVYVVEMLPPNTAASFFLSCTPIYTLIGAQRLKVIRNHPDFDSFQFISLLERDLPNHLSCCYCKQLHSIERLEKRTSRTLDYDFRPKCWDADRTFPVTLCIGWHFSFINFQMAMKRYRQGVDCSSLLNLLWSEPEVRCYGKVNAKKTQLPRISNGFLLWRKQWVCVMPPPVDIPSPPWRDLHIFICPHLDFAHSTTNDYIGGLLRYRLLEWEKPASCFQCRFCASEFRIDFKDLGKDGVAMVFTIWKNLGEGISPGDRLWTNHVDIGCWVRYCEYRKGICFEGGSICTMFEKGFEKGEELDLSFAGLPT